MSILTAAIIVLIQVATGSMFILLIPSSRIRGKFEIVGLGLALGTFLSMLSSVALVHSPLRSIAWLLPTVIVAIPTFFRVGFLRSRLQQITVVKQESMAVAIGLLLGFALLAINWVRIPLETIRAGGSVDMYFFEALSKGISEFGATGSILMSGGSLRYHWFSYAWAGELSHIAHLESFVALTRVLPLVALIGVVMLAASWASTIRIGKNTSPWWVPTLAVVLIVFAGYTGALYGIVLNFDSPSQAFTTVWLLALVMLVFRGLGSVKRPELLVYAVLVALMAAATTGGKASHVGVALGGFGLLTAIGALLRQPWWRKALVLFAASLIGAALVYGWVLAGVGIEANLAESIAVRASTWQGLDPVVGKWGPLLGTIALLLAVLTRVSGAGWLVVNREGRRSPEFLFAVGSLAVGVGALFLLRGGINELWFLLAASAPLAVISAYGVGQVQACLHTQIQRALTYSVGTALVASVLSMVLSLNWTFDSPPIQFFQWPGLLFWLSIVSVWFVIVLISWSVAWRYFPPTQSSKRCGLVVAVFGLSVSALVMTSVFTRPAVLWTESRPLKTDIGVVTPGIGLEAANPNAVAASNLFEDQLSAAEWVKINTFRSDQLATNAPLSAFIPALTGNQMYVAGSLYQAGLGNASELTEVVRRGEISSALKVAVLVERAQRPVLQQLCDAGVSYLWLDGSPEQGAFAPVYSNNSVSIYSINKQCTQLLRS